MSALLTLGPAIAVGGWLANSPRAVEATAPAAVRQAYVNQDFAAYYSSQPAAAFATEVYTNNIRVAALAFGSASCMCVPTAYLLITNGAGVGQAAGLFAAAGQSSKFYGLILPHGLLELTSVIIAGAAGLRLGWAVIDPGDRTRVTAIAEEGRRSVVLVMGVILTLLIAGLIEGFVTGSSPSHHRARRHRRGRGGGVPRLRRGPRPLGRRRGLHRRPQRRPPLTRYDARTSAAVSPEKSPTPHMPMHPSTPATSSTSTSSPPRARIAAGREIPPGHRRPQL